MSATSHQRRRRQTAARRAIAAMTTIPMLMAFAEQERFGFSNTDRAELDEALYLAVSRRTDAEEIANRAETFAETFKASGSAVHGDTEDNDDGPGTKDGGPVAPDAVLATGELGPEMFVPPETAEPEPEDKPESDAVALRDLAWPQMRKAIKELTGTGPKNMAEALAAIDALESPEAAQ